MNTQNISTVFTKTKCMVESLAALMVSSSVYSDALGPIKRISENGNGNGNGNGDSGSYSYSNSGNHFSADGRFVTFYSSDNEIYRYLKFDKLEKYKEKSESLILYTEV
ncbi:hypothetical protein [Acinetobacter venetianus]|uniref:hypothetical protein n=1 Tax=Acinetobacter venetianus TaxID=52133 RepID=UPI003A943B1B